MLIFACIHGCIQMHTYWFGVFLWSGEMMVTFQFLMQPSQHTWWQTMPWTSRSLWCISVKLFPPSLPDFVRRIQPSVSSATCATRFSLTKLRIFSSSKNHAVSYEGKWKGVQAVNLLRFTFLSRSFLQLLAHSHSEVLAGAVSLWKGIYASRECVWLYSS